MPVHHGAQDRAGPSQARLGPAPPYAAAMGSTAKQASERGRAARLEVSLQTDLMAPRPGRLPGADRRATPCGDSRRRPGIPSGTASPAWLMVDPLCASGPIASNTPSATGRCLFLHAATPVTTGVSARPVVLDQVTRGGLVVITPCPTWSVCRGVCSSRGPLRGRGRPGSCGGGARSGVTGGGSRSARRSCAR